MAKVQDRLIIPPDWKQWIAENIARQSPIADLQKKLEENGFDPQLVRVELETANRHPYVEAARSLARQVAKRDWLLHTHRKLRETVASYQIERRAKISSEEFLEHYYSENRPVVLTGCFDHWRALKNWTPEYLKEKGVDLEVEIQANRSTSPTFEQQPDRHRQLIRFPEFVDQCFVQNQTNDIYMTARNGQKNGSMFDRFHNDVGDIPEYLDHTRSSISYFLWFGPPGTVTPVHHDMTNNFMAQIVGRKRVKMIAPDFHPYIYNNFHCYSKVDLDKPDFAHLPLFERVRVHEIEIGPGDLLFLPVGWWHHVLGLATSITITCTNFRWNNSFNEDYSTFELI